MKNSKIVDKVNQLISEGWQVVEWTDFRMNNRSYKMCRLKKNDETITVNHQGGIKGFATAF